MRVLAAAEGAQPAAVLYPALAALQQRGACCAQDLLQAMSLLSPSAPPVSNPGSTRPWEILQSRQAPPA